MTKDYIIKVPESTVVTVVERGTEVINIPGKGDRGARGKPGKNLEFRWDGTKLGVRLEGQEEYVYSELKGEKGDFIEILQKLGDRLDATMSQGAITDAINDLVGVKFKSLKGGDLGNLIQTKGS